MSKNKRKNDDAKFMKLYTKRLGTFQPEKEKLLLRAGFIEDQANRLLVSLPLGLTLGKNKAMRIAERWADIGWALLPMDQIKDIAKNIPEMRKEKP